LEALNRKKRRKEIEKVTMGMNKIDPQEAEKLKELKEKISEGIKGKKTARQIHSHSLLISLLQSILPKLSISFIIL
jgi:hypothetical protein